MVWIVKTRNIANTPFKKLWHLDHIFLLPKTSMSTLYSRLSKMRFSSTSTSGKLLTVKDEAMLNTIITLVTFALVDFLCEGLDVSMFARQAALLYSF